MTLLTGNIAWSPQADLRSRLQSAMKRRGFLPPLCGVQQTRRGVHRVTCEQTDAWVEFDTSGWRIREIGRGAGHEC